MPKASNADNTMSKGKMVRRIPDFFLLKYEFSYCAGWSCVLLFLSIAKKCEVADPLKSVVMGEVR